MALWARNYSGRYLFIYNLHKCYIGWIPSSSLLSVFSLNGWNFNKSAWIKRMSLARLHASREATVQHISELDWLWLQLSESTQTLLISTLSLRRPFSPVPQLSVHRWHSSLSFHLYQRSRSRLCRQIQKRNGKVMWADTDPHLFRRLEWNHS